MSPISKILTLAVCLSCAGFMPHAIWAEEPEAPTLPHKSNPLEIKTKDANGEDRIFCILDVYDKTNDPGTEEIPSGYRDFLPKEKAALTDSFQYISDMIGFSKEENIPYIKLELMAAADDNAAAESDTVIHPDVFPCITNTKLGELLQATKEVDDQEEDYAARIELDNALSENNWYMDAFPILPSNGTDSDYYGTVTHELFHALGLAATARNTDGNVSLGVPIQFTDEEGKEYSASIFNPFEAGIRDVFGRVSYYGKDENDQHVYFDDHPEDAPTFEGLLEGRRFKKISMETYEKMRQDPSQLDPDAFYIFDELGSVNCGAYFTGNHVKEVLTLNGEEATLTWSDNSKNPAVKGGLPLNGFEGFATLAGIPDLSHIELQNSLMSHQEYRNWCTFMEAEIALLQDLGYTIDRSQYFGKSIYNSGTLDEEGNISYFTYENQTGFQSQKRHGIGLHLYGHYIDVTQKGNISANGAYSMGIRVDGVGNQLAIDSAVSANGFGGNALAVTYGKEHTIRLGQNANLVAMGDGGVAARFDFGCNELGDTHDYRGSYIHMTADGDHWEYALDPVTDKFNLPDIEGALVSRFDVQGLLAGKDKAIYISPNAYVQNINIMNGAALVGDIISEWNPLKTKYQNEDEEEEEILHPLIPDDDSYQGRTILTFGTAADEKGQSSFQLDTDGNMDYLPDEQFSLTYDDNITGPDSLEMNVLGGTLTYNGNANVYSLDIGKEATLKGEGNYKVQQGFTNEGNFQLSQELQGTTIDGDYTQSDTGNLLVGFAGNGYTDTLRVTGQATLNGTLSLFPIASYYSGTVQLTPDYVLLVDGDKTGEFTNVQLTNQDVSLILDFSLASNPDGTYTISASRAADAYSRLATNPLTYSIAKAFDKNAATVQGDAEYLVAAIDFAGNASDINTALSKLNPSLYGSEGQSQMASQALLDTLSPLGTFSSSHISENWTAEDQIHPHTWHAIAMPFSSYANQHRGGYGYKNHQTGFLGAAEHTRANGLTLGYHGAISHQSTSDTSGSVKGNSFYLGTQANYAPEKWKGWSLFGSARLGLSQMKSRRHVTIGNYPGNAWADWTGFSGDFRIGSAFTKETHSLQSGPFASLSYRFAHRPSVTEKGGAIATHLGSTTYDSLQTELGYQLATRPKKLNSYEGATWQLQSRLSWNHELLSTNGHTDYSLLDFPGITISDPTNNYGRDSLTLSAALTLRTPKSCDVTFQVGSDMYRKGGSATYGKVNVEWRF